METPGCGVWGQGQFIALRDVQGLRRHWVSHLPSCLDYVLNKVDVNCTGFYTRAFLLSPNIVGLTLAETGLEFYLMPLFFLVSLNFPLDSGGSPLSAISSATVTMVGVGLMGPLPISMLLLSLNCSYIFHM